MHKNINTIIECYSCGLFIKKELKPNIVQRCPRCNSKLPEIKSIQKTLYIMQFQSTFVFGVLNIYPLVSLNINDTELKATLIGVSILLNKISFFCRFNSFFFTIILAPILNSLIIIFAFIQSKTKINYLQKTLLSMDFIFLNTGDL